MEIHGSFMENSWKFMEATSEIPGLHGNFMEIHGKFMEITSWKFMENSWNPWNSWKIHGQIHVKFMENSWKLHGNFMENSWKIHGIHGIHGKFMERFM